jgi:dihydroneopterin aldolase
VSATTIEIRGLQVYAYHGVLESERRQGQRFVFDVWLEGLPAAASESDRLDDAVDYSAVCDRVVELATERAYDLLERLATVVAEDLRARFPAQRVRVRVGKPQVPIRHPLVEVAVTAEA